MHNTKSNVVLALFIAVISGILMFVLCEPFVCSLNDKSYSLLKATHLDSEETFQYCISTGFGSVLAYGDLISNEPITNNHIDSPCMYIEKVTERYTKHTKGSGEEKEVYYSWDVVDKEIDNTHTFNFLGTTFDFNSVDIQSIPTHKTRNYSYSKDIRYYYEYVLSNATGSLYTTLTTEGVSSGSTFFNKYTPKEVVSNVENSIEWSYDAFYVVWILFTILLIFGVIYFR